MKDIKTGVSDLALGKGYCDKKIQCEKLTEENAQLKADKAELVNILESMPYDIADRFDWIDWIEANDSYIDELIQKHKEPNNGN